MKKISLLLTVFFVSTVKSFSQDNDRKGFASINLGFSIPVGNFASNNFNSGEAGYATTGVFSEITFSHKIRPKFGITATSRGQANGVDVGAYAQDLANYFGSGNPSGNTSVSVESSVYSLSGIMAGLYGSFIIANKFSFEPRVLIGFSTATLPAMTITTYESKTKLTTFVSEHATSVAFSYIIGAGARYDLSKKICMMLNADFYSTNAEWDNVQEIGIGHITGDTEINYYDFGQKFRSFNISTGLGFRF